MDIRFLETFIAVAECGSIAGAARRMNLTSAALAQRLHRLEEDLGQSLVTRSGRTVQPTPAGLSMLEAARDLVAGVRDLRAVAANGKPAGQLRLGATATALTGLLPGIIAQLHHRYPAIEYFVQPGASVDLYHRTVAGDLDAALIVKPQFALPKIVSWLSLRHEPLLFVAPAGYPFTNPREMLRHRPFIRYDRKQWGGQIVDKYLRDHDLKVREMLELDALDAIATLVSRGLGVSILPDWTPPWPQGLRLRKVALDGADSREMGIIWRRTGAHSAAIDAFVQASLALSVS